MKKNAFLIIAHNEWSILKKMLEVLDHVDNDIYLHIDKKAGEFKQEEFISVVNKSKIFLIERTDVTWGGDSQIWCEYNLLLEATKRGYEYYHLLSGVDFPLKNISDINRFFEENKGKEFVRFDPNYSELSSESAKVKYYFLWQNKIGNGKSKSMSIRFYKFMQTVFIILQKLVGMNRLKHAEIELRKGSNWFDITHNLAAYIVENKEMIEKHLSKTFCGDEFFVQSLVWSSPYKENISTECVHYIDWDRGRPYIFTNQDYDELVNTSALFARKFSTEKDVEIVERLYEYVKY